MKSFGLKPEARVMVRHICHI